MTSMTKDEALERLCAEFVGLNRYTDPVSRDVVFRATSLARAKFVYARFASSEMEQFDAREYADSLSDVYVCDDRALAVPLYERLKSFERALPAPAGGMFCPFCGHGTSWVGDFAPGRYAVVCNNCGSVGPKGVNHLSAVALWSQRDGGILDGIEGPACVGCKDEPAPGDGYCKKCGKSEG